MSGKEAEVRRILEHARSAGDPLGMSDPELAISSIRAARYAYEDSRSADDLDRWVGALESMPRSAAVAGEVERLVIDGSPSANLKRRIAAVRNAYIAEVSPFTKVTLATLAQIARGLAVETHKATTKGRRNFHPAWEEPDEVGATGMPMLRHAVEIR